MRYPPAHLVALSSRLADPKHGAILQATLHYAARARAASTPQTLTEETESTHGCPYALRCFRQTLIQSIELKIYDLVAEALVGLGATIVADAWIMESSDIQKVKHVIQAFFDNNPVSILDDIHVTEKQLQKAEFLFQYGLINFPEVNRYQLTQALNQLRHK